MSMSRFIEPRGKPQHSMCILSLQFIFIQAIKFKLLLLVQKGAEQVRLEEHLLSLFLESENMVTLVKII